MAPRMTAYDAAAWDEIQRWEAKEAKGGDRVAEGLRVRLREAGGAVKERLELLPGVEWFEDLFRRAMEGTTAIVADVANASVRREAVAEDYRRRHRAVHRLDDIRKLDLQDVDHVKPHLGLRYRAAALLEGAASGLAASGGTLLAAGGAFAAGAGAAPGAGALVGALAVDAATVLAGSHRAVAHIAAYYGYDASLPHERLFALAVLNVGTASGRAAKSAAYVELNKVAQQLTRRATWKTLSESGVTSVVQRVYARLGMRLTQRKLGMAVPLVGIGVGAGVNEHVLADVVERAEHLYRKRFLVEKYGLDEDLVARAVMNDRPGGDSDGGDRVALAELIEEGARDGDGG